MLSSVSERSLNAIESMSSLSEAKSVDQNLANSDQQLAPMEEQLTLTTAVSDSRVSDLKDTEMCFEPLQSPPAKHNTSNISNGICTIALDHQCEQRKSIDSILSQTP